MEISGRVRQAAYYDLECKDLNVVLWMAASTPHVEANDKLPLPGAGLDLHACSH